MFYYLLLGVYKNTADAVAKATTNDYVVDPLKFSEADASKDAPAVSNVINDDVFDPYASLGNLDPTDLVQFAWQIACGMVIIV